MSPEAALPTRRLAPGASLAQARPWQAPPVTLLSPALDVITDLTEVKAASTRPSITLREAEQIMIYQGVRMLFVVTEMPTVEGLITSTDLRGAKAMNVVNERRCHWDELIVADVMTELERLDAIDYAAMGSARVGNVIATLKQFGRNHLLVVDEGRRVRGVISRAQIERQLGRLIEMAEVASSFAEIEKMLA